MFQFPKCFSADFFRSRIISWDKKQNKSKACFVKIQSSFIAYIFLKSKSKFKCDKSLLLVLVLFFPTENCWLRMMERFENTLLAAVVQHIWCLLIPTVAQTVDMGMNIQIILRTHKHHSKHIKPYGRLTQPTQTYLTRVGLTQRCLH